MSTNVCNFFFVVLVYCIITSAISIRISAHTKVKQDLLVSDNFLQKSLTNNDIDCPQENWITGVNYPAGSYVKHNNKLYEAFIANSEEPTCESHIDCSESQSQSWKFVSTCKIQDTSIATTTNADAQTELCGENREERKEEKDAADEENKIIEEDINDGISPIDETNPVVDDTETEEDEKHNASTDSTTPTEEPKTDDTISTSTDSSTKTSTVKSNSQASGETAGAGTSTSSGSLDIDI